MTRTEFMRYLKGEVERYRSAWSLPNTGQAFAMWYAVEGLGLEEQDAYEAVAYDGANDKDIDLIFTDHESERIVVAQFKYHANGSYKAKKNELLGLFHTTDWLSDPEALDREGRRDLAAAGREYLELTTSGYSVEYVYAYCGESNRDVDNACRQFNLQAAGNVPNRSARIAALGSLIALHEETIDQTTRIPSVELALTEDHFEVTGAFGSAIVTSLSGGQLKKLHQEYGDRLFERNVRLFLGARKGGVNAGLRDTLSSSTERKNFWAYNNGVTFLCDSYDASESKIGLHNFSIVNGCQTTVSLANATDAAARDAKVLVRIIAAPEQLVDSVIRFTNSQSPIKIWDLTAQDKLQRRLKKELSELKRPYLYVLRKGETRGLSSSEKDRYRRDGKIQTIAYDLNGQYLGAFRGLPAVAYKDKGKLFSIHHDEVFPSDLRVEEVVLAWQAGKVASALVKEELRQAATDGDDTRVAVLKRGATFFVLATMGVIMHQRNGAIFLNKLRAEVAASATTEQRLRNYATVPLEWYVEAMTELASDKDVATHVRTQDGWLKIKPKIISKWKVYSLSSKVMEEALPKL